MKEKFNPAAIRGRKLNKATLLGRRLNVKGHREDYNKSIPITQCLEVRATNTDKSNCLTTVDKDNVLTPLSVGRYPDAFKNNLPFRYYTLVEQCRLQTVPENYFKNTVSESNAKKMSGNGWTVDVIAHILKNLNVNREIKVLSLFNGMGCIWIALDKLGVKVSKRYASEIDKYANIVNDANYPDTIHLGDVTKVSPWDLENIDLLVGGSPCQGFSFAGKGLNFEDPRSKLFFEFVRIYEEARDLNPKVKFLLENVRMKKEHQDVISGLLGVQPIEINSALVSAQNRRRLYWTNIEGVTQPEDRGILLKDILQPEDEIEEKYYVKPLKQSTLEKRNETNKEQGRGFRNVFTEGEGEHSALLSRDYKQATTYIKLSKDLTPKTNQEKANCLTGGARSGGNHSDMDIILQLPRGKNNGGLHKEKSPTLSSNAWEQNNLLLNKRQRANFKNGDEKANTFLSTSWKGSQANGMTLVGDYLLRRLTPIECERLQTVPDNYTNCVSNTQRYKMLGNGWNVDTIVEVLRPFVK